jgi:hypothetical protein
LTWIDETNRAGHPFLTEGDRCVFFGEYFAGKGYRGGDTNQLIFNFKCPLSANAGRLTWKERAIATVANGLRSAISRQSAEAITWVPIPPSKVVADPAHDDRLFRALNQAFNGYSADVRMLLRQTVSTNADHTSGARLTSEVLYKVLEVDHAVLAARPLRRTLVLFDDVLTTGKHFKCCERRLREAIPATPIIGIFVARRILSNPFDDFEDPTQQ